MKTIYTIKGYIAHAEIDNFANGCLEEGGQTHFADDYELKSDSLAGLLDALCKEFAHGDMESVQLDACEEQGRIDIQTNERKPFTQAKPSAATSEAWKNGDIDLWYVFYSFNVEKVITGFSLTDEQEAA